MTRPAGSWGFAPARFARTPSAPRGRPARPGCAGIVTFRVFFLRGSEEFPAME